MDFKFRVWHRPEKKLYYAGYQKLFSVVLCDDDLGTNEGRGIPVKDAHYDDCDFLQGTGILDAAGREIFEGDHVKVKVKGQEYRGTVDNIPDMYKSRGLHPMQEMLDQFGIQNDDDVKFEIVGNRYEDMK
jgi:uncharacterized phage protein (TIGR01671 family)